MAYLIDTHCHLHDQEWFSPEQAAACLAAAHADGVEQVICIGTDPDDSAVAEQFAASHPGAFWTYGIHPASASETPLRSLSAAELAGREKLVAIGEIGLDYHYPGYLRDHQIRLFETMLQLAQDLDLPVSLHLREAFADAFAVLDNFPKVTGVVHSFTGCKRDLRQALERGFYIGVNGLATYTTPAVPPLERILLETDAPFLTPVPFRGKINEPRYIAVIAAYLAAKLGVAEDKIVEQTTQNARTIFQLPEYRAQPADGAGDLS